MRYAVCIAFGLLIACTGVGLLRALKTAYPIKLPAASSAIHAPPEAVNAEALAKQIVAQHLFGEAHQAPVRAASIKERLNTPAKLVGIIFTGSTAPQSVAIFLIDGSQQNYSRGETLPNGDVLSSVRANKVILKGPHGQYSLVLKHPAKALVTQARHFQFATDDGISIVQITGPSPVRPAANSVPPSAASTSMRLKALRAKLLGGG